VAQDPDDLVAEVTARLAELRREGGITQEALAESLGTAIPNLKRMLRGQNLTLRTLARLAMALGFEVQVTFRPAPEGPQKPPPGKGSLRGR
jgi:transcriptional regulator with XRE-family HTH domain